MPPPKHSIFKDTFNKVVNEIQDKLLNQSLDPKYIPKEAIMAKENAYYNNPRYILELGKGGARLHISYAQIVLME